MSAALDWRSGGGAPVPTLRSAYQSPRPGLQTDATSFRPECELSLPGLVGPSWYEVEQRLRDLLDLQPGWDSYDGRPPGQELVAYAAAQLTGLKALHLPAPNISPTGDGQILATWRGRGVEVELWFEALYRETVVIDDEHHPDAAFAGADPQLAMTTQALRRIGTGM